MKPKIIICALIHILILAAGISAQSVWRVAKVLQVDNDAVDKGEVVLTIDRGSGDGININSTYNVSSDSGDIPSGLLVITSVDFEKSTGRYIEIVEGRTPRVFQEIRMELLPADQVAGDVLAPVDRETIIDIETVGGEISAEEFENLKDLHVIGPGDALGINAYPPDKLPESIIVRPDGTIVLPLVGRVTASGKTVFELSDAIMSMMDEYVKSPWVDIRLLSTNTKKIRVFGAVDKPGLVALRQGFRLIDIMPEIGGFQKSADTENIRMIREDGTEQSFDMQNVILHPTSSNNIALEDGDILYVPEKDISVETVRVMVVGLVSKQGVYYLEKEFSKLLDALTIAGGVTETADINNIKILRQENGDIGQLHKDVEKALAGQDFAEQNIPLENGDIIYVTGVTETQRKQKKIHKANAILKDYTPLMGAALLLFKIND